MDETARTYELEEQIAVPFSGYVSSAQRVGDSNSMLVASGQAKTFSEYDRYGLPIATYEMEAEKYIYRVYKYELLRAPTFDRWSAKTRRSPMLSPRVAVIWFDVANI